MKLLKSGMATALEEKGLDALASHAGPLNELTVSSPDSILTAIIHTDMFVIEMHSNVLSHCPFSIILNSNDTIPTAGDYFFNSTVRGYDTESFKWVLSLSTLASTSIISQSLDGARRQGNRCRGSYSFPFERLRPAVLVHPSTAR